MEDTPPPCVCLPAYRLALSWTPSCVRKGQSVPLTSPWSVGDEKVGRSLCRVFRYAQLLPKPSAKSALRCKEARDLPRRATRQCSVLIAPASSEHLSITLSRQPPRARPAAFKQPSRQDIPTHQSHLRGVAPVKQTSDPSVPIADRIRSMAENYGENDPLMPVKGHVKVRALFLSLSLLGTCAG